MDTEDDVSLVTLLEAPNLGNAPDMDPEVMDLMPSEDEPGHVGPIYGPHLPGLEAGNTVETAPNNSPVPSSFMAYDNPTPTILADIRDPSVQPGQSGLQNMGNTCFMNSVLQCLMHNSYLCHSLLGNPSFQRDSLTGRFVELLTKIWEGQYAVVHPSEFKEKLGLVHGQFKDFRQHDGQEFLALLLDSLHQELNWNTQQRKIASPATDLSEESDDSHYASEASSSKLSELEALDLDSVKDEPVNGRGAAGTSSMDSEASTSGADVVSGPSSEGGSKDPVRLPSIEEFYKKDVKTLNTNMLQENEASVSLSTGSDKFPCRKKTSKADRLKGRTENSFQKSPPKNKKTNVIAARKARSHEALCGSASVNANSECSSSTDDKEGIKRIKLDSVGDDATEKPSNVVAANFHDYVTVAGSGEGMDLGFDPDSEDQLGLETLSRRLKQELDNGGPIAQGGCDSSESKHLQTFQNKNDEMVSKLADLPSSTSGAKCVPPVCAVNGEVVNLAEVRKNFEFVPNNKEHLSSLQLEKPLTSLERNHEGERQWEEYLRRNESVIVDNFHGQLKSTVVCQACRHVSIIYEPFMYLSVPLPRAMEKQFVVTFVRSGGQTPIRYAVVLNKTDTVTELRRTLLYTFYGEISGREIVLAEALDCHLSRILEDGIQLQYVNSSFRLIYAFEIEYKPCVTVTTSDFPDAGAPPSAGFSRDVLVGSDQGLISSTSDFASLSASQYGNSGGFGYQGNWDLLTSEVATSSNDREQPAPARRAQVMEPDSTVDIGQERRKATGGDIFSNMGSFKVDSLDEIPELVDCNGGGEMSKADEVCDTEVQASGGTRSAMWVSPEDTPRETCSGGTVDGASTQTEDTKAITTVSESALAGSSGTAAAAPSAVADDDDDDDMKTEVGDQGTVSDVREELGGGGANGSQWHICIICLEEMPGDQLLTHQVCQGKLCQQCVNRTKKHYGEETISCPVCRADMNPETDFVPLVPNIHPHQPLLRVLLLPVQFRNEWVENGERKMMLFGHPNVLYIMSRVSGEELFSQLENITPISAEFAVALTDAQGLHCSRCPYEVQCSGCHLAREVDIDLSSDDHLTVCFYDLSLQAVEEANRSLDHETMEHLQGDDPITLFDCFKAFTASEELDECNPWFCPECKKNQKAMKTMAIQKFPNTLIVYLKRFVFHQFMSTKLDNKVQFPVTNLRFSELVGPDCSLVYDLQSAVCHFGGVNSGHYTSYVRNPITGTWQYCNDETITERVPADEDANNVYILFYQRKDTVLPFKLPSTLKLMSEAAASPGDEVGEATTLNTDDRDGYSDGEDITKLVASLVQEGGDCPLGSGAEPVRVKEQQPFANSLDACLSELD